jgi:hypothetical protein
MKKWLKEVFWKRFEMFIWSCLITGFGFMALVLGLGIINAKADGLLEGDERSACEALLCLSSGKRPTECQPSLNRYFSIHYKKPSDTYRARKKFLDLCPQSNQNQAMSRLTEAIAYGAGRCDADSLNRELIIGVTEGGMPWILNQMPGYCEAYATHEYTDLTGTAPLYVGVPERGGHWVEAQNYEAALQAYNQRIAEEDLAKQMALQFNF